MEGYAKLARTMGRYPELAIFRTFQQLNMKNLLYLQAELMTLERNLEAIAVLDHTSGNPGKEAYQNSWVALSKSKNEGDTMQLDKMLTIRKKIEEYSKKLISFNAPL